MGRCTDAAALAVVLLLGGSGCMTGHLLDAARRRERPVAYREAWVAADRLVLGITMEVTDDAGDVRERVERWAAVRLDELRRPTPPTVDRVEVDWLTAAEARALGGARVGIRARESTACGDDPPPDRSLPALEVLDRDGRPIGLVLCAADGARPAPLYSGALTRLSLRPWVYPLLPVTLAVDAVTNPVLLFFAPAVLVVGE